VRVKRRGETLNQIWKLRRLVKCLRGSETPDIFVARSPRSGFLPALICTEELPLQLQS
jgi:hypothetical protein